MKINSITSAFTVTVICFLSAVLSASFCMGKEKCTTNSVDEIYTPHPKPQPRINGPLVYGCHPGNPFLYRIPCQGERPIRFSVKGLPPELKLDPSTGILTGKAPQKGEYEVMILAHNSKGKDKRKFKIVAGDQLSLTPPMGWNSWYVHFNRITDKIMREAADNMVSSGMADIGYQYVNIDDCWMNASETNPYMPDSTRVGSPRDRSGNILPNSHFPDRFFSVALKNAMYGAYSKPGAWNDPDYLQIGWIGAQKGTIFTLPQPCPLTAQEQYSYMSLWCLMAAPLFFSGDMSKLDEFTLNILCNPEVIEVDQDPLGKCGSVIMKTDDRFLMVKNLADGSMAVGFFNRGKSTTEVTVNWAELQLSGKQSVRDLWRQKEMGVYKQKFSAQVPANGVVMIKIRKRK